MKIKTKLSLSTRVLSATLLMAAMLPATTLVTLPGSVATTEGNGASFIGSFFGANSLQVQIAESELLAQGLLPGFMVTGMSWRLNAGSNPNTSDSIISDLEILLGQAVNAVTGMSTTFADNLTNGVLVHDGAYTIAANSMPSGGTPNAFGPAIPFAVQYVYQGGDLLVQIRRQAASVGIGLDASSTHVGAGTLYGAVSGGSSFAATSGSLSASFPVMQFQVETPEPGAWSLMLMGLGLVGAGRLRRVKA